MISANQSSSDFPEDISDPKQPAPEISPLPEETPVAVTRDDPAISITDTWHYRNSLHTLLQLNRLKK